MPTLAELHAARCTPLRGIEHQLSAERTAELLAVLPTGWRLIDDGPAIEKTFRFTDYYRTMAYVNALAFIAHAEDHHPDLGVHYDRCVVRFSTHDVGGLSINDFICAAKAESLLAH
jgi:4a-hydroxytetrahydrobiopterin dehydratase